MNIAFYQSLLIRKNDYEKKLKFTFNFIHQKIKIIDSVYLKTLLKLLHPDELNIYNNKTQYNQISYLFSNINVKLAILYHQKQLKTQKKNYYHKLILDIANLRDQCNSIPVHRGISGFPYTLFPFNLSISNKNLYKPTSDIISIAILTSQSHPISIDIEIIYQEEKIDNIQNQAISKKITPYEIKKIIKNKMIIDNNNLNIRKLEVQIKKIIWCAKESLTKVLQTGFYISNKILELKKISIIYQLENKVFVYQINYQYFPIYKSYSFVVKSKNLTYIINLLILEKTHVDLNDFSLSLYNIISNIKLESENAI